MLTSTSFRASTAKAFMAGLLVRRKLAVENRKINVLNTDLAPNTTTSSQSTRAVFCSTIASMALRPTSKASTPATTATTRAPMGSALEWPKGCSLSGFCAATATVQASTPAVSTSMVLSAPWASAS
ncbi:MAG: hypothetical protein ICCCNLDF_02979 [Planctomycetes bacterium]|nr:hypothetical protein [Planctomycetota bacterium]